MIEIALQLYTVRSHTARNMLATLRTIAAMGYRAVELAGFGGTSAREIRHVLDELGMRAIGAHIELDRLSEHPQQVLSDMQILGCRYVVVPWVMPARRSNPADVQRLAEEFNRYGAQLRAEGIRLAYHNHAYEFAPLGPSNLWSQLLAATDPALVCFELDLYWARYAGVEPIDLIEQHRERLPLLHFKDMAADHTRADVPIGMGIMPWKQILSACGDGERWAIIEQDHPRNPLENVQFSLQSLRQIMGR
jgi:sugar phosphate isomerase/epimerase